MVTGMGVEVTDNKYCPIMASPGQDSGTGSFKGSLVWLHGGGAVILMSRSSNSVQRPVVFYSPQMSRNTWGEYLKYELVIKSK